MKIFRIQRVTDNLFSKGGMYPQFSKKGRSWSALGHVVSHLNQCVYGELYSKQSWGNNTTRLSDCILIEYDVADDGSSVVCNKTTLAEVIAEADKRRTVRNAAKEKRKQELELKRLEERKKQLAREMATTNACLAEMK